MTCAQKKTWKLREATMIVALAWTVVFAPIVAWEAHAQKQPSGQGAEAMNMGLLGTHDLQARSAYQPGDPGCKADAGSLTSVITVAAR